MKHKVIPGLYLIGMLLLFGCALPLEKTTTAEPVTINGTYEYHREIRGADAAVFTSDKIDTVVKFTATSQADNSMKGVAHITYTEAYEFQYNEEGYEPCHLLWATEPIIWTAELTGRIQQNTDGSLTVVLLANPKDGPPFSQQFDCDAAESKIPSFAFVNGVLVDGKYKNRIDYALHPMTVGSTYEITSMEVIP